MHVFRELETCVKELGRYVCPIYVRGRRRQTPYLIGTGALLFTDDDMYLATAAHVTDTAAGDTLVISGNSTFLTFDGPQIRWSYEKDKTTDYDIVVFHVHQEYRSNLKPFYRFIQTDDFSTVDAYSKLTLYAFVGFPHSKNRPQRSNGKDIEAKSHYFVVREFADLSKIDSKDKRKEVHVAFFAPLKKITDIQFRRKAPPNPQGMSGCAVWKIKIDEQTGWVNTCHFVGIGIEHTPSAQAFIATKSEWIYYAISELKRKMSDT